MASFNLFVKEVTVNEWVAEGGTALEALGKETAEPGEPSLTPLLKSGGNGKRIEATLKVPAELATELAGGAKVTALTVHLSAKASVNGSANTKFGTVSPAVTSTPALTNTQAWHTVSFTKEQAEAQTTATLEALVVLIEKVLLSGNSVYESYVSLETAGGGATTLLAKPEIRLTLQDSAVTAQALAPTMTARFVLRDLAQVAQAFAAALSERLELKDPLKATFIGESVLEARIVMPLSFKQSLAATQAMAAQLADRMSLKCAVKANFVTEGGSRRIAIFIFDE